MKEYYFMVKLLKNLAPDFTPFPNPFPLSGYFFIHKSDDMILYSHYDYSKLV